MLSDLYYTDGWMDEQAEVNIMAGKDGLIDIEFMYPGELEGNETVYMTVDDNMTIELKLENNVSQCYMVAQPDVVGQVHAIHDETAVPDDGLAPLPRRPVDRHVLADDVVVPDAHPGLLAPVSVVLRVAAHRRVLVDMARLWQPSSSTNHVTIIKYKYTILFYVLATIIPWAF